VNGYWEFQTRRGVVRITPENDRFLAMFEDEALGWYSTPEQALDDLIAGTCAWPSIGSPAQLGLPDDLRDWNFIRM